MSANWRQALRIVHVSDPHMSWSNTWKRRLAMVRDAGRLPRVVASWFEEKMSGHDPAALPFFRMSAMSALEEDEWPETLLAVTGDLTTWGDAETRDQAVTDWTAVTKDLGLNGPHMIYGNHDVWPDQFPLFFSPDDLDSHRSALHAAPPFNRTWPVTHYDAASGQLGISLLSLNTVLHGQLDNTLALGEVRDDRYWQANQAQSQLAALASGGGAPSVRVILTHHPIAGGHHPAYPWMALADAPRVAQFLSQPQQQSRQAIPIATVVLSGHTHRVFPAPGRLQERPQMPLTEHQIQLTAGTFSQVHVDAQRPPRPISNVERHTWQMLGFWLNEANDRLLIERDLYMRGERNTGPFYALPTEVEEVVL